MQEAQPQGLHGESAPQPLRVLVPSPIGPLGVELLRTAITRVVVGLADELCQGRVVSVLEGGYRLDGLADSVTAHVQASQGR